MPTIESYPYEVRERAAIYEYDGNMNRMEAEARAIMEYRKEQEANASKR